MTVIPELPAIDDIDLLFDVLTPKDLRQGGEANDCNVNQRLAELGEQILSNVVTIHYFLKKPTIRAEEIKTWREHQTKPATLSDWLDSYQLKDRLRVPLDMRDAILSDPQQMAAFFHSYVAAVYLRKGLPVVQAWIAKLIDPEADVGQSQPSQSTQNENTSTGSTGTSIPRASVSSTTSLEVPVALVNQVANQRGATINYVCSSDGPPHMPSWTVRCDINGVEKGVGVGSTQKAAKEQAARRAWVAMGW